MGLLLDPKFTVSTFSLILAKVVASAVFDFIIDDHTFLSDQFFQTRDDGGIYLNFSITAKREDKKDFIKIHFASQVPLNDRQVNVEV
ncbi:MAG: hypothetical protein HQK96_13480 [Nitrospirae bacterium]|nr:hypothetical protein [Nitrospirota bacterium]